MSWVVNVAFLYLVSDDDAFYQSSSFFTYIYAAYCIWKWQCLFLICWVSKVDPNQHHKNRLFPFGFCHFDKAHSAQWCWHNLAYLWNRLWAVQLQCDEILDWKAQASCYWAYPNYFSRSLMRGGQWKLFTGMATPMIYFHSELFLIWKDNGLFLLVSFLIMYNMF